MRTSTGTTSQNLTLTILMMVGSAFVIAVCPSYETIGAAAPAVLLLARLVQGFSAGVEFVRRPRCSSIPRPRCDGP